MDVRPGGLRELLPVSDLIQLDFSIGWTGENPATPKPRQAKVSLRSMESS